MAKLGRPKAAVVITEVERTELVRLTRRAHVNRLLAFRARLVLACADAPTDTAVARRYRTTIPPWGNGESDSSSADSRACWMSPGSAGHGRSPMRTSRRWSSRRLKRLRRVRRTGARGRWPRRPG